VLLTVKCVLENWQQCLVCDSVTCEPDTVRTAADTMLLACLVDLD